MNVNDDDATRYAVTRTLRRAGLAVEEAATGAEAFRLLAGMPDLVILDVDLPDVSGFEVCQRIKENPRLMTMPVLQLSAKFVKTEDKVHGLEGGADGYLTQPFDPAELIATVNSLLRLRRAERKAEAAAFQWQATFEAISDGVCLADGGGRALRWNRAFELTLGTTPAASGKGLPELLRTWSGLSEREFVPTAAGARTRHELRVGDRWFVVKSDPVLDAEGGPDGAVYTLSEVTDRKRAEEAEGEARKNAERIRRLEGEIRALERIGRAPPAGPSAATPAPLSRTDPGLFADLAGCYGEVLELALEQRQYKVTHNLSARLASLGERLGASRAGPRDVIELHNAALEARSEGAFPARLQAYLEEGRLLLLELLGCLVTQYRRHAPEGHAPAAGRRAAADAEEVAGA